MNDISIPVRPIRAGVYETIEAAQQAIERLLISGFTADQITVMCTDDTKERYFREFEHEQPAGANTPAAASVGGAIGAAVGSLAMASAGAATGDLSYAVAGGAAGLGTGGVLGGFLGAMLTRGVEKGAADFYDQARQEGEILVAVEVHGDNSSARLEQAAQILTAAGAKALPLNEG